MTSRPLPQCAVCVHWRSPLDTGLDAQTCTAFPGGIPDEIWWNRADHRKPFRGDRGTLWTPLEEGTKYPVEEVQ